MGILQTPSEDDDNKVAVGVWFNVLSFYTGNEMVGHLECQKVSK